MSSTLEGCKDLRGRALGEYKSPGWYKNPGGYKSLGGQGSGSRRGQLDMRLEWGRSLGWARKREGTKGRSMGGDWQEPGSGKKQ